ncbi:MAG: hypothetical protein V4678_03720 [Patescibacteria group bacterium]
MIEINLVPDVKLELLRARKQQKMVISIAIIVAVVSVGVVALMTSYAFGVQSIAEAIADGNIEKESNKLNDVKDLSKTLTIQSQLGKLSSVQEEKAVTSRLFDIIGVTVPSGENQIKVSQLSLDSAESRIDIEAQAVNGYEAMEVFKKTLAQTKFQYSVDGEEQDPVNIATSISEGDRNYGEDAEGRRVLRFTLSFMFPDELFDTASRNGRVIAPDQQRATDSTQGVPESLFSDGGAE